MPGSHPHLTSLDLTGPNHRTLQDVAMEPLQQVTLARNLRTTPVVPAGDLRVQAYTTWHEVAQLRTVWEQLLRDSRKPTIFSTPEWLGAWWQAYGHDQPVLLLLFTTPQGAAVGLAPLYLSRLHGRIRCLRFVGDGSGDSDNLDLIVRAGYEDACAHALLDWLAASSEWDCCELNTLPADSAILPPLLRSLRQRRWVQATSARPNFAIPLPDSWEAYLQQLPKKQAANITRYMRRLPQHHAVRMLKCIQEEELPDYLAALFDLHQRRWAARGEAGSFALPERRDFYAAMSRAFLRRGWLELWLLELDGTPVAADFSFRYGQTVYGLQAGFDPAYQTDKVGNVLFAHTLQHYIASGVRCYDFLGGTSAYKTNWGAQPKSYTNLHFARPLTRGGFYLQARDGAEATRQWLQAHAPQRVYAILRDIYHRLQRR